MSGWDLYWVLKLDSIIAAVKVIYFLVGCMMGFLVLGWWLSSDEDCDQEVESRKVCKRGIKWLLGPFVLLMLMTGLLPTTKEMAAILIVPKIATTDNIEAMSGETKEIYGILKKMLIDQVEEKEKE